MIIFNTQWIKSSSLYIAAYEETKSEVIISNQMHPICSRSLSLTVVYCLFINVILSVHGLPGRGRHGHGQRRQEQVACKENERYHRETEQCYPLNLQGPCGENMMFIQDPNRTELGACVCQDHTGCHYWPFTYSESEKRCYPLFERGPCKENEWLVNPEHRDKQNPRRHDRDRNSKRRHNQDPAQSKIIKGECQPRGCGMKSESQKMFLHEGTCYELETQGFCSTNQERMYFTKGCAEPKCFNKPVKAQVCEAKNLGGGTIQRIIIATPVPPKSSTLPPSRPLPPPSPPTQPIMALSSNQSQSSPEIHGDEPMEFDLRTKTISKISNVPCAADDRKNADGSCQQSAIFA